MRVLLEILTAGRRGRYPSAHQVTLSESVRTLVSAMLCSDPMQRASLAEVKKHEWMLMGGDDLVDNDDGDDDDESCDGDNVAVDDASVDMRGVHTSPRVAAASDDDVDTR
jgi:serine/threonine protein kinase